MASINHSRRTACRIAAIVVLFGFISSFYLYWNRESVFVAMARALTIHDAQAPADYLVVLGGGAHTRPFAAAELYHRGFAPQILLFTSSSTLTTTQGLQPTHSQLNDRVLQFKGVPAHAIRHLRHPVTSSWDEAQALKQFLESHPAQRIILVTTPEHCRRARWIFRKVLSGLSAEIQMAPAYHLRFDETNWWKDDEGALLYLHEYLKLPYYWLRYTWGI